MRKHAIALLAVLMGILSSCTQEKEILVPDNTAPPDYTIPDITVESYINRTYIALLGRKAEEQEFADGTTLLRSHNLSQTDRENFVLSVISNPEYYDNAFKLGLSLYLNSADTVDIRDFALTLDLLANDPSYQPLWPEIRAERDRLYLILDIPADLAAGTLSQAQMHRRLCHNYYYDQINMGTTNFVISMFESFLHRFPTGSELEAGERMVDGFTSTIFLQNGRTKEDFLDIFFATDDYFEGQVRELFNRYLFREPDTGEMESLTASYSQNQDFEQLLLTILSTEEFAGL